MVKVISLSDDVYRKLKAIKRNMSFSEIIRNSLESEKKKKDITKFCGIWEGEEWGRIIKELMEAKA